MCRLLAYKGAQVSLDDLLYKPRHSLIKQSFSAVEMDEPLNGDGFGIGWYSSDIDAEPAVFKSVRPAWNNINLQSITPKIFSKCVFGHVRAASVGNVSHGNCHPFQCGRFMMMHNGDVENFKAIRRPLLAKLSDRYFHAIGGQTDSEHIFALFLEHLSEQAAPDLSHLSDALKRTIDDITRLQDQSGTAPASQLNLLITDGTHIVGSRFATGNAKKPLSLYYATGGRFECKNEMYSLRNSPEGSNAVLIVSERLNHRTQSWNTVPANHLFTVDSQNKIAFTQI